jgi:hypothetical protein
MSIPSELNYLISQAHASLEAVDSFDLDSDDPDSAEEFGDLDEMHREDVKALVAFVTANSAEILAALK